MNHNKQHYRERRTTLLKRMRAHSGEGLALVPTAPEVPRNRDSLYPYRHDSYAYYLSGFPEPEAVIALVADDAGDRQILFCREKDNEREIWDGFRYGPDAAREIFGFDAAHPVSELPAMLPELAANQPALVAQLAQTVPKDFVVPVDLGHVQADHSMDYLLHHLYGMPVTGMQ